MDLPTLDHMISIATGVSALAGMLLTLADRRRRRRDADRTQQAGRGSRSAP